MRWMFLLLALVSSGPSLAAEFEIETLDQVVPLHGVWRFRAGDDLRWADPAYDDGQWDNILVPRDWRRQGHKDLTGIAWYRATINLDLENREVSERLYQLGITMGKVHSAYELYAGGRLLGGAGRLPPDPQMESDRIRIFSIPPGAVSSEGELLVAVRVWRYPVLGNSSTAGLFEGEFLVGNTIELTKRVGFREAVALMLVVTYLGFGLYHLFLYARNRRAPEFLWFGLVASLVAVYTLELSQWRYIAPWLGEWPFLRHEKIEYGVIYLLPALGMQLLVCLLGVRVPTWGRVYQAGFAAFALVAVIVPGFDVLSLTLFPWQLYVSPGLLAALITVVWQAARGNLEARTMTVGWAIFLFCALNDILVAQGAVAHPRLLPIGFLAVLVSMAVSLSNRFTRIHNDLEGEVRQRTLELEQANEKLVEAARLDALTGLLNRRGFVEAIEGEIARASRTGRGFVIMMGDIDRFKSCNDRYGHACGDFALQEVARLLKAQLRDVDTLARWGGEEFIFLLPETTLAGGATLAEKLRSVLEHSHFRFEDKLLTLTMTLGVAAWREGMSMKDCIAEADNVLYAGKQGDRNVVVVAGDDREATLPVSEMPFSA